MLDSWYQMYTFQVTVLKINKNTVIEHLPRVGQTPGKFPGTCLERGKRQKLLLFIEEDSGKDDNITVTASVNYKKEVSDGFTLDTQKPVCQPLLNVKTMWTQEVHT